MGYTPTFDKVIVGNYLGEWAIGGFRLYQLHLRREPRSLLCYALAASNLAGITGIK